MVYTVCASVVISPLRQWLDSYSKTRLKMCHTFKHFIHMLYEPRQCSLFWDFIPESKRCFCVNLCRTSGPYSIRPIQKLLNCQTTTRDRAALLIHPDGEQPKTALWLWVREITWYLYTRGVRGRMKAKQRWLKLLENCVMNGFIMFGFMTATGLENSPQSFDVYTVSQSRSVVTSAGNPAPENSPQSTGELRNGHVANLQELSYQTGSKNGVI